MKYYNVSRVIVGGENLANSEEFAGALYMEIWNLAPRTVAARR